MKRPIFVADTLMKQFEQAIPFERIRLHTEFREVNRDVVLNDHKEQKEDFLQFIATLNRSMLELELQRDKEEREKTKQELISSWKEEHRQNQKKCDAKHAKNLPPDLLVYTASILWYKRWTPGRHTIRCDYDHGMFFQHHGSVLNVTFA